MITLARAMCRPVYRQVILAVRGNRWLWTDGIGLAWNRISLTEKCLWIFIGANTLSLLTVMEYLLLK